jgi:hypothetical protein
MSVNQLYLTWQSRISQLRADERITRTRNMAWLIVGIFLSRAVHLSRVAGKIPSRADLLSAVRRLSRFLDNPSIRVREWYAPIARDWLDYIGRTTKEIRLIADGTKIGFGHQLLMIAVCYRHRAIPIAWTWVNAPRGHSSGYKQCALLNYVRGLLPKSIPVVVVGDSEFGAIEVIRQVKTWHWHYVLRQKANNQIRRSGRDWQNFGAVLGKPGESLWLGRCLLTRQQAYATNLLAHWALGEKEPWLLATDLGDRALTLQTYARRMGIEEMFGDLKRNGFDLESTHLQHIARLSRLTLAVALLYTWLVEVGVKIIKNGLRHWVDRADRRDLSIFQIGFRSIDRRLTNALSFKFECSVGYSEQTVR